MRKIGIIALLLVTVQSVSAQVSISASTSNGAGGQTVVQTDTIAGQRLWPDFHAVEVEGAMKVRSKRRMRSIPWASVIMPTISRRANT